MNPRNSAALEAAAVNIDDMIQVEVESAAPQPQQAAQAESALGLKDMKAVELASSLDEIKQ